jgi:hypothetical protein
MTVRIRCPYLMTPSIHKKLAQTSPTSCGRSVGIVRSRTKATVYFPFFFLGIITSAIHMFPPVFNGFHGDLSWLTLHIVTSISLLLSWQIFFQFWKQMESSLGYSVGVHNSESLQLFMYLCEVLHCDLGVMSVSPLSIRAIRSFQLDVMLPWPDTGLAKPESWKSLTLVFWNAVCPSGWKTLQVDKPAIYLHKSWTIWVWPFTVWHHATAHLGCWHVQNLHWWHVVHCKTV